MAKISNKAFRQILATIKSDENVIHIPVGRDAMAMVDAGDEAIMRPHLWRRRGAYAATPIGGKLVRMHHVLLGDIPEGFVVDHINGDGLDNRRSNLRVCLPEENARNRRKTRLAKGRFKGVVECASGWFAKIEADGVVHRSEVFVTDERAAREYDRMARRFHREFAKTNADLDLY